ncbi:type II toxin-antitoxin system RelB family antitoxin [Enterococcus timonensis]|uniref:type II toxin-antitoxin system RelB family antitoxin n=1 Tax=Enterococcus timonensis TaxID=1852364 RepID=UPI0008D9F412|nr:DUF6290 family protein [Enterococcus timonensis]
MNASSTITFRVSHEEKEFLLAIAKFNGVTLSEWARKELMETAEDKADLETYKTLMKEHLKKDQSISHEEMLRELGL